ncbi:hypothetical protein ACN08Z_01195 [Rothia sp. P7181]|uniref:hypothetical protein n=1 Tax=unclassified Rothia (in: high G+C Gram-positive bacteria) TaxID=2689056 RepID=UPI003AD4ABAC
MSHTVNRRHLVKGAAWAAPVVLATSVVPVYAASCDMRVWEVKSRIVATDPDYSNHNYDKKVLYGEGLSGEDKAQQYGEAEMQHWYDANSKKLMWRLHIGLPEGAASGAMITIPIDPSWSNPSAITQGGLELFLRLDAHRPELYSESFPPALIEDRGTYLSIIFAGPIPKGAGAVFTFSADPKGGEDAVLGRNSSTGTGDTYTAEATIEFKKLGC